MRYIRLWAEKGHRELNEYFTRRLYKIDFDEKEKGLCCYIGKGSGNMESFCTTLSDYIWTHQVDVFLKGYLRRNPLLTEQEAMNGAAKALSVAMSIKDGCDVIKEKLIEYFNGGNRYIIIEGFLRFRMQELKKDLTALADLCADELIAKREYEEFIALLRSFVDIQKPSDHEVHLFAEANGAHRLFDSAGQDMLTPEELSPDITPDDLILSTLVSVAPCKIYLYNEKNSGNPQLLDTVKSIFPGRVLSVSAAPSPALPGFSQEV